MKVLISFLISMVGLISFARAADTPFEKVRQLAVGDYFSCVLTEAGKVDCWGNPVGWQMPPDDSLTNVKQLSANGQANICALKDDDIVCWGSRPDALPLRFLRQDAFRFEAPQEIQLGDTFLCGLYSTGVQCFPDGPWNSPSVPPELTPPFANGTATEPLRQVAIGGGQACFLSGTGLKCASAMNAYNGWSVPKDLKNPTRISMGWDETCALTDDGVRCWNYDDDERPPEQRAKVPAGLARLSQIAVGGNYGDSQFACGVLAVDGSVTCWGQDAEAAPYGIDRIPAGLTGVTALSTGVQHICALSDRGVTCWGSNYRGQSAVPPQYAR